MTALNEFDLAFIVDTTGSMGGLIQAAQKQMVQMVEQLTQRDDVNIHVGIVQYRDHPPQDRMIFKAHAFTSDLDKVQQTINKLTPNGGGDGPEAVFAGIVAACEQLKWREHSHRIAVLIGDAPPHGVGASGDAFPRACPSGETIASTSAKLEEQRVTLYSLALSNWATPSFTELSQLTGGRAYEGNQGNAAIKQVAAILEAEFSQLQLDQLVYAAWEAATAPTVDTIAEALEESLSKVSTSVNRLRTRELLA